MSRTGLTCQPGFGRGGGEGETPWVPRLSHGAGRMVDRLLPMFSNGICKVSKSEV